MGQLPVIAIGPALLSPLVSLIVYLIARRRLKEGQDSSSRAHLFYRLITYLLLGQFLGHVRSPNSVAMAAWLVPVLVAAGYFALDTLEAVARVWRTNPHLVAHGDNVVSDDIALNRSVGEDHNILVSGNVGSPMFQQSVFAMQDVQADVRKRRWILALLLGLFLMISFVDGLELIVATTAQQEAPALLYVFYYMHNLSLSLIAYSAMIHSRLQRIENMVRRLLIWWALTLVVSTIVATSAIMLLAQTLDAPGAKQILADPTLTIFYGLAAGFLLRVQQYFHAVKMDGIDKWDTLSGIVVAFIALSQAMATSVFF
jgi:hypothetical protein